MVLDLERFDFEVLVFFDEFFLNFLDYLFCDVIDMGASPEGANAVHEGNLLELSIG